MSPDYSRVYVVGYPHNREGDGVTDAHQHDEYDDGVLEAIDEVMKQVIAEETVGEPHRHRVLAHGGEKRSGKMMKRDM